MLDFFCIFSKSGIVIFATVNQAVSAEWNGLVNRLIKNVILEARTEKFSTDSMVMQHKLDNEFDLVFVVGYQKILSLTYLDKFLTEIQLAFRDKYNDFDLRSLLKTASMNGKTSSSQGISKKKFNQSIIFNLVDFDTEYNEVYTECTRAPEKATEMRTFAQSSKSQKTISSMVVKSSREDIIQVQKKKEAEKEKAAKKDSDASANPIAKLIANGIAPRGKDKASPKVSKKETVKQKDGKKGKNMRSWGLEGKNDPSLDYSKSLTSGEEVDGDTGASSSSMLKNVSGGRGIDLTADYVIKDSDLDLVVDSEDDDDDDEDEEEVQKKQAKKSKGGFFSSIVNTLSLNQVLTKEALDPVLIRLRDHLVARNVASNVAANIMGSIEKELEGKEVKTWSGLETIVRKELAASIGRILSPNRVIDILSDIRAKKTPPYVITFCGVNGVGKSTNLAKIANWLIQNSVRVCVIACDTFRAGAVEQLKTHVTALQHIIQRDSLAGKIHLHEKGYGKDAAAIAMEGINFARNNGYNCCLVDTAGRMQDNEPLMMELSKLIRINEPDLTLFVGEAVVGNEGVDQVNKFNRSLLDHGCQPSGGSSGSVIDGIVLTKFDAVVKDGLVGAAVSMTYETGQPIVFVGVGQKYNDLRQLNVNAVVNALIR